MSLYKTWLEDRCRCGHQRIDHYFRVGVCRGLDYVKDDEAPAIQLGIRIDHCECRRFKAAPT